jgi:hypothetical protein
MHFKFLSTTKGLILVREILRLCQFFMKICLVFNNTVLWWLAFPELGRLGKCDGIFSNDTFLHWARFWWCKLAFDLKVQLNSTTSSRVILSYDYKGRGRSSTIASRVSLVLNMHHDALLVPLVFYLLVITHRNDHSDTLWRRKKLTLGWRCWDALPILLQVALPRAPRVNKVMSWFPQFRLTLPLRRQVKSINGGLLVHGLVGLESLVGMTGWEEGRMSLWRLYSLKGRCLEIFGVLRKWLIAGGEIDRFEGGDLHSYVLCPARFGLWLRSLSTKKP